MIVQSGPRWIRERATQYPTTCHAIATIEAEPEVGNDRLDISPIPSQVVDVVLVPLEYHAV